MKQQAPHGFILFVAILMVILVTLAASGIAYFVSYSKGKQQQTQIAEWLQQQTNTLNTTLVNNTTNNIISAGLNSSNSTTNLTQ